MDFFCGSADKESACNAGDLGSIPGLGRDPGEGKGYPLQDSGLENPMGWLVHGVAKCRTRLSDLDVTSLGLHIFKSFLENTAFLKNFLKKGFFEKCQFIWLHEVVAAAHWTSLHHVAYFTYCMDSPLRWITSVAAEGRLPHSLACGILVPQPGIESTSPALHSGFWTTGPPGKPQTLLADRSNDTIISVSHHCRGWGYKIFQSLMWGLK